MRAPRSLFPFFVVVATLTAGDAGTGAREEVVPAATPLADYVELIENEYDTLQACREAGSRFKKAVTDGHKDELGRQRRHEDHENYRKHAAYCPPGHTVSAERECDGENIECPGGNTY